MDFRQFIINEMIIHKLSDNPSNLLAFRSHLWLYDEFTPKESRKIYNIIKKEHPQGKEFNIKYWNNFEKGYDVGEWARENIADAFVGQWDEKKKVIWTGEEEVGYTTSPLVKKVMQALGAKSVQYKTSQAMVRNRDDKGEYWDYDVTYRKKDVLGTFGSIAYHGTSTKYLPGILKFGLKPNESETNYNGIIHEDKVFLAYKFSEAEQHATHTASQAKGWPVVIMVKIPDPALIVPDYDADLYGTGPKTYPDFFGKKNKPNKWSSVNSFKTSKHAGVIGYQGRIPANFIEGVYLRINNNWKKVRLDTLRKRIEKNPWEWGYAYGMWE
jgi:hypothetical protein